MMKMTQTLRKKLFTLLFYSCFFGLWQTAAFASVDYQTLIDNLQQTLQSTDDPAEQSLLHSQLGDAYFANQQLIGLLTP